jgi:hypothetical protein
MILLMWIIVDTVFLAAVVSGMCVRLFLDPRKFMVSIGKRIFSISTYVAQTGWLKFHSCLSLCLLFLTLLSNMFALLKYVKASCKIALDYSYLYW